MLLLYPASACMGEESASYDKQIIIIGDSRALGMQQSVGLSGCIWVTEVGKGCDWMIETAVPQMDALTGEGTHVVIMLGINDVGDTGKTAQYAAYINAKAKDWALRGARTYYAGVTDCAPGYHNSFGVDAAHIAAWNSSMNSLLSSDVTYLDINSMISTVQTMDGIHYTSETYVEIFEVLMAKIGQSNGSGTGGILLDGLIQMSLDSAQEEVDQSLADIFAFAE